MELNALLQAIEAEARREPFPIDVSVYEAAGRDPFEPTLCAGSASARICSFGRDPGRDEVRYRQPQIGAAGKQVRRGILKAAGQQERADDPLLEDALSYVFLTNTVPYKPPGNKAYPERVKARFRPYVAQLLARYWQGDVVLTLGTEAFYWFEPYAEPGALERLWKREDRYESELHCVLAVDTPDGMVRKELTICPLPHPSPLNQRWFSLFPDLLASRLQKWFALGIINR